MNKYQRLYNSEDKDRNYNKFQGNILKSHISNVLYKNELLAGFLERIEPVFSELMNSVKKLKTIHRPFINKNYKNFN